MKGSINMNENEIIVTVPYLLTVKQASDYFNIGARVIRALADADVDYSFHMYNGNRLMIKREAFENFLKTAQTV